MKLIFSKKGFDTQYGKKPSIINTKTKEIISFPIPVLPPEIGMHVTEIKINDVGLSKIFEDLNIELNQFLHIDPTIQNINGKQKIGTLGQAGSANGHLRNQGIGKDDIFLFYGSFSFVEEINGSLNYHSMYPFHCIWGYLIVDEVIECDEIDSTRLGENDFLKDHPHIVNKGLSEYAKGNSIYIGKKFGVFNYHDELRLTKPGYKKTYWSLPQCFRGTKMTYNQKKEYKFINDRVEVQVASKAQEFVVDANSEIVNWVNEIIDRN